VLDKDILNAMRREFPLAIDALKKSSTILNRFWNDQKGFAENCLNELHLPLDLLAETDERTLSLKPTG